MCLNDRRCDSLSRFIPSITDITVVTPLQEHLLQKIGIILRSHKPSHKEGDPTRYRLVTSSTSSYTHHYK